MKKRLIQFFTLCLVGMWANLQVLAQDPQPAPQPEPTPETQNDTTIITWGKKGKILIIKDEKGNRRYTFSKEDGAGEEGDDWESSEDDWDDDWEENWDDGDGRRRPNRYYSEVGFLAFDLGVTNYYNAGEFGVDAATPDLALKSFRPGSHVALHFLPTTVSLFGRGVVNLKTAITIDWNNYYFTEDVMLVSKQETLTVERTGIDYDKNKLVARYAQIPLMLNFNTAPDRDHGVSLSFGGYAGVLWESHTKQKSDEEGKNKVKDDFNLNNFRYGLTARLDFRWFDFYFNINLSELFDEENNLGTQTFTTGLNLINF